MPLFDFRCLDCEARFEALVRPASYNDPAVTCRACGSHRLERLLPTFAVSSAEQTRAFAASKNKKAAAVGRQERLAEEREAEAHRREDHGIE